MIHFAQAQYLLLILLIPFFFVGYALFRRGRNRKIAKIGSPQLMAALMPTRSKAKGWVRISFFAAAWFFFAIGLARPQIGEPHKADIGSGGRGPHLPQRTFHAGGSGPRGSGVFYRQLH